MKFLIFLWRTTKPLSESFLCYILASSAQIFQYLCFFFTTLFNVHLPFIFLETCFSFSLCILNLFALRIPYIIWILLLYMRVNWQAFPLDMCFPFSSVCVYTFTNCTMMSKLLFLIVYFLGVDCVFYEILKEQCQFNIVMQFVFIFFKHIIVLLLPFRPQVHIIELIFTW